MHYLLTLKVLADNRKTLYLDPCSNSKSSRPKVFYDKAAVKKSLELEILKKAHLKSLVCRYFPDNFAKFLRIVIL